MSSRFFVVLLIGLTSALAGAGLGYFIVHSRQTIPTGRQISDFALLDQAGRFHQLTDYADRKAIVLYGYNPNCPGAKQSLVALEALQKRFASESIAIFAIDPVGSPPESEMESRILPVLHDEDQIVTESLGILRSGEALLVDPATWTLRYRGPIDDRIEFEAEHPLITNNYLDNAIEAVLNGEPLEFSARVGMGCPVDFGAIPRADAISYRDSIVPILEQRCLGCHRQGGVGPWPMDRYATVKSWAAKIREAILLEKMPPWYADPAVGEFAHNLGLEASEKKALIRWIDAGAPRGGGSDPLEAESLAAAPAAWPLGEPDIVIKVPTIRIPAEGLLAYQYIKLPVPIEKDTWIRAVHVKPSNRAATHHIFAFVEYPNERKQDEPKWAEGANGYFAAYVPGYPVVPFPDNSGRLLPGGSKIIFQRHYLTLGHPTEDNLELGLYLLEKAPALEFKMATAVNMAIRIPPHARVHPESATVVIPEDGALQAIYPHMHYRGSSIRVAAVYPDGHREALLSVPKYRFQWQNSYQLKNPKALPAGTRILVDAEFDNSTRNPINPDPEKEVRWGPLSSDEMLVAYMMYTTPRKSQDFAVKEPSAGTLKTSTH
ncbi:MAG: redoxin domain-containing protein [Gammaproteobacteria bacterium]